MGVIVIIGGAQARPTGKYIHAGAMIIKCLFRIFRVLAGNYV
jgi:hypothetical protein